MDQRAAKVLLWLSLLVSMVGSTSLDSDAILSLLIEDAPDVYNYWKASAADNQVSLEFQPESEGGSSSGTWSARLEYSVVTPEAALEWPHTPDSKPLASQITQPSAEQSSRGHVTDFSISLGQFTLVRKPSLDRESAGQHCAELGGRVAVISMPDNLYTLRDLMAMYPDDEDAEKKDAFVEIADGVGRPIKWKASEIADQACLTMGQRGELVLRACTLQLAFFCEQAGGPPPS